MNMSMWHLESFDNQTNLDAPHGTTQRLNQTLRCFQISHVVLIIHVKG